MLSPLQPAIAGTCVLTARLRRAVTRALRAATSINGLFSGDEVCITVRAANKYGASAWAETWCDTVAY